MNPRSIFPSWVDAFSDRAMKFPVVAWTSTLPCSFSKLHVEDLLLREGERLG